MMPAQRLACSVVVLAAIVAVAGVGPTTGPMTIPATSPATAPAGYRLVWHDEFDTPGKPDPAKWTYERGFVRNREPQVYTDRPANVRVADGCLVIEARREHVANPKYDPAATHRENRQQYAEYSSACLTTEGLASWTYGRLEVRAKLPNARGAWPAIWMLGTTDDPAVDRPPPWPACGETDVMELWGSRDPDRVEGHLIWAKAGRTAAEGAKQHVDAPDGQFHVYAAEWTPAGVDFAVDGRLYKTVRTDTAGKIDGDAFRRPQYLLLNLAVEPRPVKVDDAAFPQRYVVDWVRFYQKQ